MILGIRHTNHYVQVAKAMFDIAVTDKVIIESPAKDLKYVKVAPAPVRVTPYL